MTAITEAATGTYSIDPSHSRVGFVARHAMITKVRGAFNDIAGTGSFDANDPTAASLSVTIQTASVDTRNADRDGHLRSDDFFAVETHPTIEFVSTSVAAAGEDQFQVVGDLTIKGVTNEVTLDLEVTGTVVDPWGMSRIGLEGSSTISRKNWGLTWNTALEAGGVVVGDKIVLEFDISAVKAAA